MYIGNIKFLTIMTGILISAICLFLWSCIQKTKYQKMLEQSKRGGEIE